MINICIPYTPSQWGDGEELRYALRSWDRYFQEDFTVWVIGDIQNKPLWLSEKCWLHCPDVKGKWGEVNTGLKLDYLTQKFTDFFWAYDDFFLLRDLCQGVLKRFFYMRDDLRNFQMTSQTAEFQANLLREYNQFCKDNNTLRSVPIWELLMVGTIAYLQLLGDGADVFPLYNWETHMPYFYESDKLRRVATLIPIFKGYALTNTAYCNVFLRKNPRYQINYSIKAAFYVDVDQDLTEEDIKKRIEGAFCMNVDDGILKLKPCIKAFLSQRFTEQSRWEIGE